MILNYILNLSLIIGSYIVPKNKKLFLIGAANGKSFIGNSKYFYLYCLKNNKKIVWTTKSKKVYNMLKLKKMPVIKTKSLSGWWNALRANKIIITQGAIDFTYAHTLFGNFDIIQTWHGAPIKKVGFDCKINGFSDKIFRKLQQMQNKHWTLINTSKYVNKIHKKAFNPKKVLDLGHPRNDILFNKELKFDKIPKILELNNVNKVILYTPTYRKFDKNLKPFSEKFLRKLNNQLKKRKWIFLIKKHPLQENIEIENYSNIKDISTIMEDVQVLYKHTDLLINDYSSCVFDYSLLKKPFINYCFDLKEYIKKRGLYINYFTELIGPIAINEDELYQLILQFNNWSKKEKYKEDYGKFLNKYHTYQDGDSCKRLAKEIGL